MISVYLATILLSLDPLLHLIPVRIVVVIAMNQSKTRGGGILISFSALEEAHETSMETESLTGERETITILALLREKMDGVDGIRRRRSLKERLGLKSMCCCGATWSFRPNTINLSDSEDDEQLQQQQEQQQEVPSPEPEPRINSGPDRSENISVPNCVSRVPLNPGGMNLAAALAAERHFRAAEGTNVASPAPGNPTINGNTGPTPGTAPGTPLRVSLMRLLAETDGCDVDEKTGRREEMGHDAVCCVCMGRKKGAAFIPCGHTFCRVCSREMWLNRGSCPLCNRSILEILDIF